MGSNSSAGISRLETDSGAATVTHAETVVTFENIESAAPTESSENAITAESSSFTAEASTDQSMDVCQPKRRVSEWLDFGWGRLGGGSFCFDENLCKTPSHNSRIVLPVKANWAGGNVFGICNRPRAKLSISPTAAAWVFFFFLCWRDWAKSKIKQRDAGQTVIGRRVAIFGIFSVTLPTNASRSSSISPKHSEMGTGRSK